jgi:phosphoribosylanthranilate isomerase
VERSKIAGLDYVQLHGDGAREALSELPGDLKIIYVMHATPDGVVQTLPPSELHQKGEIRKVRFN